MPPIKQHTKPASRSGSKSDLTGFEFVIQGEFQRDQWIRPPDLRVGPIDPFAPHRPLRETDEKLFP
jgi:hypothetical protein